MSINSWGQVSSSTRLNNFLVAESAFLNTDLFKAEVVYQQVIKDSPNDDYAIRSMDRLVTIAQLNGDKKLFGYIMNTIKSFGDVSSDSYYSLVYNIGKYLFYDGSYISSIKFLDTIGEQTSYYPKSIYIKAACLVTEKKYKDAVLLFDRIIRMNGNIITQDLKELAILGKARIFMIMKRYDKALREYQSISQWSPYYIDSLKETSRVFLALKDYDNAIMHLETLAFVNSQLYTSGNNNTTSLSSGNSLTDFDLMNLKTIQGYIYTEKGRFEEASQIFNEIILNYNFIKKNFSEQINRFKTSDDLTQLVSHPNIDGSPRSLINGYDFVLFHTSDYYSTGFREWLNSKEKVDLKRYFSVYYSLLNRVDDVDRNKVLSEDALRFIALRNLMNKSIKTYMDLLIKRINGRLDDVGLKAQLGKIDITWRTKENQSKKIKEIQEQKQEYIDDLDSQYMRMVE